MVRGDKTLLARLGEEPERLAFRCGDKDLDWGDLDRLSARYVRGLFTLGLSPGDRVAVFASSPLEVVVALVGHLRAGFVHVPINTGYQRDEVAHILSDSGARAVVVAPGSAQVVVLDQVVAMGGPSPQRLPWIELEGLDRSRDDAWEEAHPEAHRLAMLIYTSGTTGRSKGVMLDHGALTSNIGAVVQAWAWSPKDTLVLALPLFHVHGLGLGILGTLLTGNTTVILARFDAATVAQAMASGGSIFMGVPTMYARLIRLLEAEPGLSAAMRAARLYTSGSAALPADHWERFRALTGHEILERYGMSETLFTLTNPYRGPRRPGTVGRPVPGCELRIVDDQGKPVSVDEVGEIQVRSNGIMRGYWQRPKVTETSFSGPWFCTGDVASQDREGYVTIVGRRSVDIIKSGGYKISAREIEEVLLRHPAVVEVAVVGVPDEEWGERIGAAVVMSEAQLSVEDEALCRVLADYVGERLAAYKKPTRVVRLEELPRNALGKLQKHRLRPLFREAV